MKKLTTFLLRISLISTFILLSQTAWSARYSSSAVTQLNTGQTVNPGTTGHQVIRVDLVGTGNNVALSWDLNSIQFALTNNTNYSSAKLYYRSNNSNFGGATLISTINNPGANITFSTFSTTPSASGGSASTLYLWLVVDIKSSITCNGNSIDASVPANGIDIGGNGGGTKTPTTNNPSGNGNISSSVTPSVSIAASTTSICAGSSITFTATPTNGGSTPSYQWKVNGNNTGTNSATFATNSLQNNDAVTCVLTSNDVCASPATDLSNSITITVSQVPTSGISPSGTQNLCGLSGSQLLTANSNMNSGINYQWKKDGSNISGANASTYTATSAGSYTVVISNSSNTSCSTESAATVVNFIQLTASAILSDSSVCYGSSAQLNSRVNPGSNNGSYTNNTSSNIPDNNSNGTSSTISAGGLPSSLTGLTIRLTANVTHQYNGDVELYLVRPGGSLGAGSSGTNFRSPVAGQSILLSSDNGGSGQNYTGVIFSDAAATLISSVTGNQNITGEYRPEQLFSTLTGNPNGTWTLIAVDDASTDVGTLTSWTIEFSYSSGLTYSWTSIPSGFTSSIANPGAVSPTQTTTYIVNATETASGCSVTDSVTLTINGTVVPTAAVTPSGAQNICPPQTSLTLTASSSISSPNYQWYKNGSIIPGETGLTYTVNSGGSYYVVASGIPSGECVATSNEVPAFYHSTAAIQAANDTMICAGGTAQLTTTGSISETQQFTQGSPLDIPDNITPVESNLSVSNLPASLAGVTISVTVNSTHAYNADQEFYLVRPGGTYTNVVNGTNRLTTTSGQSIVLSTDNGGSGDNYDITFTDSASVLVSSLSASNVTVNGYKRPEQLLSTLTGNPNGTWKLVAIDDENIDAGVLNSWTLTFTFSNGLSYSWTSVPSGFTSNVKNPGAVNPTTTTTYIVTATDQLYGCSASDTMKVYLDTISPVAQCKNITIYLDANGTASITGADINNNSTDNCAIISLTAGQTSFTCANIGANTVSLTVTDATGNSNSCNATVTVLDTVSPVVNCQNITIYLDANGTTSITAADINNNSTDNCAIISLTAGQTSFTCANIGANTVSLIATDASGNSSSCNATVTVLDTVSPVANCQNISVYLDANGTASITAADINNNSTDNCAIISLTAGQTSFTCANIGANTVSLTVTDASGNSKSCNATVTVLDTVSPVANCQNATIIINETTGIALVTAAEINLNSSDNCSYTASVSPSTFDCTQIGNNTVTLTIVDPSGNSASCQSTVTVTSNLAISGNIQDVSCYGESNGNIDITISGGSGNYTYLWSDNSTNEDLSNSSAGTYTVTVFDATGCSTSVVFQISSPDSLHIDLTTTNVSCNGLNDGTATSIISGGTTPYTYYWDNDGEITPAISGLYAGTYQLEVTDDNGCVKNANFEIFEPAPPIVDAGSDGEVCAESTFTLNGYIDGSTTAAVWSTSGDGVFGDINALQTTYTPGINDSIAGSVILVLTGNNLNGLCPSKSDTLILTVNGKPAPATTILGPRSVCRGNSGSFSIAPTSNTDTYVWSYISGQDITISPSIDNLSAIVAFGNTITNSGSYIFVQGINQCGIGAPRQLWVRHDIGNPQFATPAQAVVCPNTSGIIYRVRKVQGADSLTWTVPAGCTYVQLNDTTISTDFGPTYTSGDLIVTAHFSCGNTTLIRKITSGTSRVPGVISGPKNGLCDTTVVFSIAAVSGAASYNWTMPTGATIVGPANGTSVSVYFAPGFTKSSIAVAGVNACGVISNTRTIQVSEKPATPTTVIGPSAVCAGQQNIQYTVAAVTGANGYQWTIPSTATLVSGQGSNSIIVNWGSVTGSVNVKALRNCSGLSTAKTYPVSVNCRQAEIANNGISINNLYPNPNHGAFTLEIKSSETTDAQFILTDISGRIVLQTQENINEGITTYPMSFKAESGTYILKVITSTGVSAIRFFAE